jgi:glycosyltransferase involved in cell wall biosynthesis
MIEAVRNSQARANNLRHCFAVSDSKSSFSVSVIVPVRNEESSIGEVIESLMGQSLPPQEIIFVDGGSSDKTKDMIRERINDDGPLRLIEHPDAYPGRARNLGIHQARTEWIAMTDAGTIIESDWLANLVREAASSEGVDVVLGSYDPLLTTFFQECLALAFVAPAMKIGESNLRGPSTASMMIRKSVWEELGRFPEQLRGCEDLLFFDRLARSSHSVRYAPGAVVGWRIPDSFAGAFRRFRTYSMHTLKAGLGGRWHLAIARMYLAALAILGLAVFHHWSWMLLFLVGFVWRAHRTIRARRPSLKLRHSIGLNSYFLVGIILVWIDVAAFMGFADYLFKERQADRGSYAENV